MTVLVRFIVLIVIAAGVIFILRWLRPRIREQRHRRWEEAGLLPHQVDPHAPREPDDEPRDRKDG